MINLAESAGQTLLAYPHTRRVPARRVELYRTPRFLTPDLCDGLIALIDAERRPSTITDSNGDPTFRTSETCDLEDSEPIVVELERLLFRASGIDPVYGERVQGQRYAPGQEFKAHTDYFEPSGRDYDAHTNHAGNRTWTLMIYLNEPDAGGATRFKKIGQTIQPETGKLLAWNNRRPDGTLNPDAIHHGMKVRTGTKYVITKWYRERPWRV